jgi:hypothetical protein
MGSFLEYLENLNQSNEDDSHSEGGFGNSDNKQGIYK